MHNIIHHHVTFAAAFPDRLPTGFSFLNDSCILKQSIDCRLLLVIWFARPIQIFNQITAPEPGEPSTSTVVQYVFILEMTTQNQQTIAVPFRRQISKINHPHITSWYYFSSPVKKSIATQWAIRIICSLSLEDFVSYSIILCSRNSFTDRFSE